MNREIKILQAQVNKAMDTLRGGLFQVEQRVGASWNVVNALIRVLSDLGIEKGWWKDHAEFEERFKEAAKNLLGEALEHRRKEDARIKEERESGKEPAPMAPIDTPIAKANEHIAKVINLHASNTDRDPIPGE